MNYFVFGNSRIHGILYVYILMDSFLTLFAGPLSRLHISRLRHRKRNIRFLSSRLRSDLIKKSFHRYSPRLFNPWQCLIFCDTLAPRYFMETLLVSLLKCTFIVVFDKTRILILETFKCNPLWQTTKLTKFCISCSLSAIRTLSSAYLMLSIIVSCILNPSSAMSK